jgi:hypothetical protein
VLENEIGRLGGTAKRQFDSQAHSVCCECEHPVIVAAGSPILVEPGFPVRLNQDELCPFIFILNANAAAWNHNKLGKARFPQGNPLGESPTSQIFSALKVSERIPMSLKFSEPWIRWNALSALAGQRRST